MKLIFVLLCSVVGLQSYAQEFTSFNITQQQGLPSNTVYDIFQDSKGFLWVATENGLARYNGASFRTYNNTSVRSMSVSGVFEDKYKRIWCHNFFGEILFIENDSLKKLVSWEKYYSEGFPTITDLGDSLLISTGNHIYSYNLLQHKWNVLDELFENDITFWAHHKYEQAAIWVSYTSGKETFVKDIAQPKATKKIVRSGGAQLNSSISKFITWQDSLMLFDPIRKRLFSITSDSVVEITHQYKGILTNTRQIKNIGDTLFTFLSAEGLTIRNRKQESFFLLAKKNVSSVTTDKEGGLWVGTLNEGLFYFADRNSVLYSKNVFGLFPKLAVYNSNNQLFAGQYSGGLSIFAEDGSLIKNRKALVSKEIQSIYIDEPTETLVTFTDALYLYNLESGQLIDKQEFASVKKIVRVDNEYALATSAGLYLYNPVSKKHTVVFSPQRVATVEYYKQTQTIWAGTQKGLYYHHLPTNKTVQWQVDSSGYSPGITSSLILGDLIFFGTLTNGLYVLRNNKLVHHLTTTNGLPSNRITALAVDKNTLWMGTDNGICSALLSKGNIQFSSILKGVAAQEVYDIAIVNNNLWVSHALGLQKFNSFNSPNIQKPIIHLNEVSSDGNRLNNFNNDITLQPESRQLSFTFDVSNNLKSRGTTKILYRIKELDGDRWNETTLQSPTAHYLSLPYGDYTFEAKAKNEEGVESANLLSIPVFVIAPFWKQLWFTLVIVFLTLSFIGLFVYLQFKKLNERSKFRLQQQSQEQALRIAQLTSLRAQMNPHFIFNTMSLIQGKVLNGLKEDANRNIQNFSLLLRKVLDFSDKEMIALQEEVNVLENYLAIEQDRFDGSLHYSITLDERVKNEMIRIPSLLTQPFVENAIRHGLMHKEGIKKLQVSFTLNDDCLHIRIDDNGIGRKSSGEFNKARKREHTSFAVEAYQKRIELLNTLRAQKIELKIIDNHNEHGIACGTTVLIKVPMDAEKNDRL